MQPFIHKSVCRQSLSLLMLFCSKPSSLQKAAYFYCQKFQPDPSLKTQSSQMQHWAGFFQPYLKEIRGTCISVFELSFRTLTLSLLNHWWSRRKGKLRRWATVSSHSQLGHLGPQIRLPQLNGSVIGSMGSFLNNHILIFLFLAVSLRLVPLYFSP